MVERALPVFAEAAEAFRMSIPTDSTTAR